MPTFNLRVKRTPCFSKLENALLYKNPNRSKDASVIMGKTVLDEHRKIPPIGPLLFGSAAVTDSAQSLGGYR
jgi:hypothetical protein